ncbi:MAG: methylated-DNA--[protein]-cysteine S-methyltransferase [Vulcanimicrobiota bacterium]
MTESFPTALGWMEAEWNRSQLVSLNFSEPAAASQSELARAVQKHFQGDSQESYFNGIELANEGVSEFSRQVYEAARAIPSGSTTTYGELARQLDKPGAARAVGSALGRNPYLLVVPCHRILGQSGFCGFSAPGGVKTKELMLAAEGVGTESLWDAGETERALDHLRSCPRLGPVISRVGPPTMKPSFPDHPFASLGRAVLYQQLAGSAAAAIMARVCALGSEPFPSAREFLEMSDESLREAGVSGPKIATLKRLSEAVESGRLCPERLHLLPDAEVEAQISSIKGLGNWSARMFLLFHLGRRDVFPVKDLGVRKAMQRLFKTSELPNPDFMLRKSKPWRPYRSLASWYLWRSLEN